MANAFNFNITVLILPVKNATMDMALNMTVTAIRQADAGDVMVAVIHAVKTTQGAQNVLETLASLSKITSTLTSVDCAQKTARAASSHKTMKTKSIVAQAALKRMA